MVCTGEEYVILELLDRAVNNTSMPVLVTARARSKDHAGKVEWAQTPRPVRVAPGQTVALRDADGLRLRKTSGGATTSYVFSGSKVMAEYTGIYSATAPAKEYIYAGSQLLATLDASGTPTYHHPDHLLLRVNTNSSRSIIGTPRRTPTPRGTLMVSRTAVVTRIPMTWAMPTAQARA